MKRLETLARERDGYEDEEVEEELNGGGAGMDGAAAGASATPMAASTTNTQDEAEAEASHPSPVTASSARKNPNGLGENVKGSISSGPSAGSVAGDTQNRRGHHRGSSWAKAMAIVMPKGNQKRKRHTAGLSVRSGLRMSSSSSPISENKGAQPRRRTISYARAASRADYVRKHTSIQHEIPERQADTNSASKTHGGLNLWRKAEKKILAAKKAHHVSRSTSLPYTGTDDNDVNE